MGSDIFCSRLKALRGNTSQEDLAAEIRETRAIVRNWELGKSEIKHPALKKLAEHFHVSADYLLGLTDVKTEDRDLRFVCDYLGLSEETVKAMMELKDGWKCNEGLTKVFIRLLSSL